MNSIISNSFFFQRSSSKLFLDFIRVLREELSHSIDMAGFYHEVLECIEDPDVVYEGKYGELIGMKQTQKDRYIVVMYKEESDRWVCDYIFYH